MRRRLGLRAGDDVRISEEADGCCESRPAAPLRTPSSARLVGPRTRWWTSFATSVAQRLGSPAVTAEHVWAELDLDIAVQLIRARAT
jgi:hypothetical protein